MKRHETNGRRVFLSKLLGGGVVAAGALMGLRAPALARLLEGPGEGFDPGEHDCVFVVDIQKCIGCGNCVRACSVENNVPEGQFRTWIERYVVTDEGVHVDSPNGGMNGFEAIDPALREQAINAFFVPKLCNHCSEAPCVQVCPVGATFASPEGFVLVDPEHCIGCGYCIQACPYGVRFMNRDRSIADKCSWCYHRIKRGQQPACVTVCPTGSRIFGDAGDENDPVAQVLKDDQWDVLKPGMHTQCQVLYVGLPRVVV